MSAAGPALKIQVGLAVNPKKAVYIVRPSDDELLRYLEEGEYCNVLCSRQMGKTSLLHRTRGRLAEKGIRSALIDVAGSLGTVQSADTWYLGLLQLVAGELGLPVDVRAWWSAAAATTPNQRLIQFFREEVAGKTERRVVIFLDEIDSTLKLPFTDDLFVALRAMYNDRVREPAYERLAFCLVGVATPNELIKERRTTPYNVGRMIELGDYDPERDDLGPLQRAVSEDPQTGAAVVRAVVRWTGGHPYLTARLCDDFVRKGGRSPEDVERMVAEGYSSLRNLERDIHFEPVLRFMQERVDDRYGALQIYRRIWRGRRELDRLAPAYIALKLAGIVKRGEGGALVVRNPIYRRVFTDRWARDTMPALARRLRAARYAAAGAVLVGMLAVWLQAASQWSNALATARDDYSVALDAHQKLRRLPLFGTRADELLAGFYERRALRAGAAEDRDQAILWRLKAQEARPTLDRALQTGATVGSDGRQLLATFHTGDGSRDRLADIFDTFVSVAFSPDDSKVLTGSDNNAARLWNAVDGSPIGQPLKHSRSVRAVAFSPDGSKVLTASDDDTARLWNASDGSPIGRPLKHSHWVRAIAFSPDGNEVLTGSDDDTARLWKTADGSPIGKLMKHGGWVRTVAFNGDGSKVLTSSDDNTARLWNASDGSPIGKPLRHSNSVLAAAFSPDGSKVLTGSDDDTARLWNTSDGSPIGQPLKHSYWVRAVTFSPDGSKILTGSFDGTARLWNASDGSPIGQPMKHSSFVLAVAFSPDGSRILTGSDDDTARLWSASDGSPIGQPLKHSSYVRAIAFSRDGSKVLTASADNTARLWSVSGGSAIGQPLKHSSYVLGLAFSPDGSRVLTGSADNTARLYDAKDGSPIGQPLKHSGWVRAVAFSPDGSKVLTGSADNSARLWNASDGSPIGQPLLHSSYVRAVAFSPDGSKVLTGSDDNTARLWNASDGSPIGRPLLHSSSVRAVAFSPDGSKVLTGSDDNRARLWNASDGSPVGQPLKHSSYVLAVAFSPDGSKVLTATSFWVHVANATDLSPVANAFLPAPFLGFQSYGPGGTHLRVAVAPTGDSALPLDLDLEHPVAEPLAGNPALLLEEWQRRLGLRITEAGTIEAVQ